MGCILKATSGSVCIAGQQVEDLPENQLPRIRLEHIGFVFQGFNLLPTLTAGENVEVMLRLKGFGKTQARRRACRRPRHYLVTQLHAAMA
jgi:putative ABC transport system ATP-binding protein